MTNHLNALFLGAVVLLSPFHNFCAASEVDAKKDLQLLTVFLDVSEAYQPAYPFTTGHFVRAVRAKAGVIIASSPLLTIIFGGQYYDEPISILDSWRLKEVAEHMLVMIPKNMNIRGLKTELMRDVTLEELKKRYESFPVETVMKPGEIKTIAPEWDAVAEDTGKLFVRSLDTIFVPRDIKKEVDDAPTWVIYLCGHGGYGQSIAAIPLDVFPRMLEVFQKRIDTYALVCNSCYAAGDNAAKIFGELKKQVTKEYPFAIITYATGDAPVLAPNVDAISFQSFIDALRRDPRDFKRALEYILPNIKTFEEPRNIAQLRPANTSLWIPVMDNSSPLVNITQQMALTRKAPLVVSSKTVFTEKKEKKVVNPKAIMLYTNYIPFEVRVETDKIPNFAIALPGDAAVYFKKLTIATAAQLADVYASFDMKGSYKGNKFIFIEQLDFTRSGKKYKNLVYDIKNDMRYPELALEDFLEHAEPFSKELNASKSKIKEIEQIEQDVQKKQKKGPQPVQAPSAGSKPVKPIGPKSESDQGLIKALQNLADSLGVLHRSLQTP